MPTIQGRTATARKSAVGIEHRKPWYLIAHEDHPLGIHDDCHRMEKVANVADEITIEVEELDSVVLSVTDNHLPIIGKGKIVWGTEFPGARSGTAPAPN